MSWVATIDWYQNNGYQLIPLDPFAKKIENRGKKPRDKGWRETYYSRAELLMWTLHGGLYNLGARMSEMDLVVDIDPRKGGDRDQLMRGLGTQFRGCPVVSTGNKGWHIYTKLEAPEKLPSKLVAYPGVEFKSLGFQVVVPNSVHPLTGQKYCWEIQNSTVGTIPKELIRALRAESLRFAQVETRDCTVVSNETLAEILKGLPVEDFHSHDEWFSIMTAAYHATAGEGIEEFVEWSLGDPDYADEEDEVRYRWSTLASYNGNIRTVGTLVRELQIRNKPLPKELSGLRLEDYVPKPREVQSTVEALSEKSSPTEIRAVLADIAKLDPLDQDDAIDTVSEITGRAKRSLKKELKPKMKKQRIDIPERVAETILEYEFKSGKILTFALDKRYWRYNGTFWEPYCADQLKGIIKRHAQETRDVYPRADFQLANVINAAEVVLRASVANGADLLGTNKAPNPVVNCVNNEIWIDGDSFELKKHHPDSLLTYCLPIEYDSTAKCDVFDDTIDGIFSPLSDGPEVIRHLWEVFGYTIQPHKFIPAWFLFQGRGANGKSLILDVLMALLGPTARPIAAISELSASRSEFALSECVGALAIIDDDVKKDTVLNDDILKKLSEDKLIRARFLRQNSFTFRNCSTTFLASNSWPRTRDLSDGMVRRAYGFPFRRQFKQDPKRRQNILDNELPGVLNKALEGFVRLKKRGYFDVPDSCKALVSEWLIRSNQVLGYLEECHSGGRWEGTKELSNLWAGYERWATENGMRRVYSKPGFREALLSFGILENETGQMRGKNDFGHENTKSC